MWFAVSVDAKKNCHLKVALAEPNCWWQVADLKKQLHHPNPTVSGS